METTLENNQELETHDTVDNQDIESTNTAEQSLLDQLGEEYLRKKFRGRLLSMEILTYGIGKNHSVLHMGSSYMENVLFTYISDLYKNGQINDVELKYTGIDVKQDSIESLNEINKELFEKINFNSAQKPAQEFIDDAKNSGVEYDWSVITGIFDKNKYGSDQFKFVDTMLFETLNLSKFGVIFTFDASKEKSNNYSIRTFMSYLDSTYGRYKISKLDDEIYIICVYKYQYSINN